MAKKKKTMTVEELKHRANRVLFNSVDSYTDGRAAIQMFIEQVLMDTGNYKGFGYLSKKDMVESLSGCSVGINNEGEGTPEERFKDTDSTRVQYY